MNSRRTANNQSDLRGYCQVRPGAEYAGVSVRTFRDLLKAGLRHSRLESGTILISYAAIDEYLEAREDNKIDVVVDEVLDDFK